MKVAQHPTMDEIKNAKEKTSYILPPTHSGEQQVLMAYQWFDAQNKIKNENKKLFDYKHTIEQWCGSYISTSDVEVAATLHPDVFGSYGSYNISSRLVKPNDSRLLDIPEAFMHKYYRDLFDESLYPLFEDENNNKTPRTKKSRY